MRIGIVSDTHGDQRMIKQVIAQAGPVALWLHAGDYVRDGRIFGEMTGLPVHMAAGNCDPRAVELPEQFLTCEGYRIMLTHGHRYRVKDGLQELVWWGRQYEVNIVVFGHTHKPVICREEDLLIINPGSPAFPRGGSFASFAVLELTPEEMLPVIVELR